MVHTILSTVFELPTPHTIQIFFFKISGQTGPSPASGLATNWDLFLYPSNVRDYKAMVETKRPVLTEIANFNSILPDEYQTASPTSVYNEPVLSHFGDDAEVVGTVQAILKWDVYFKELLSEGTKGIYCVVKSDCVNNFENGTDQSVTFLIEGTEVSFVGEGDLHETQFDDLREDGLIVPFQAAEGLNFCSYSLTVFPSQALRDDYDTNTPVLFTSVVLLVFLFTSMVFVMYDCLVQRRQDKVMTSANRTDAIVSSLFPKEFRERIYEQKEADLGQKSQDHWKAGDSESPTVYTGKPIADLFPNTTVMFADIVNFTGKFSCVQYTSVQVYAIQQQLFLTDSPSLWEQHGVRRENQTKYSLCWRRFTGRSTKLRNAVVCSR